MKLYRFLFLILLLFFSLAFVLELSSYSDGPPASRTAAPGELNCSNGYCHNNFALNSGPGVSILSSSIPENGFRAGQTYEITAKVAHPGQQRFGFMVLAYDSVTQVSTGEMALTETDRTQLTLNMDGDRTYVTHDPATIAGDSSEWTFNWTAPGSEDQTGAVSFYATFVAANNNNNASGDYVYATRMDAVLDTSMATPIREELSELAVAFRLLPQLNQLTVEGGIVSTSPTHISVMSLNAQELYNSTTQLTPGNPVQISTRSWASGIYILKLQQGFRSRVHKFRVIN